MKKIIILLFLSIAFLQQSQAQDNWYYGQAMTDLTDPNTNFVMSAKSIDPVFDGENNYFVVKFLTTRTSDLITDYEKSINKPFIPSNKSDIGLSNVQNLDQTNPANIVQNSSYRFVTDAEKATWDSKLSVEVDGSVTNEIQGLTLSGNLLGITGGNTVALPTYTNVNLTAGNGISITGTYPNLTISVTPPTITTPVSRTLNSNFTVSTTKTAIVSYSVACSATNPLLVGTSSAMAYLEYSLNGGSTWILPSQSGNSNGVGVAVAIQLTNTQTGTLTATIPANALVRIRTVTSGTATVTYITGTEATY